jgi:hypothetical protein
MFTNGGPKVIEAKIEQCRCKINGVDIAPTAAKVDLLRILPTHQRGFGSEIVLNVPTDPIPIIEMKYSVIYGQPGNYPRYRRTHTLAFTYLDQYDPKVLEQRIRWWDVEVVPTGVEV